MCARMLVVLGAPLLMILTATTTAAASSEVSIEARFFAASPAALGTGQQIGPGLSGAWRAGDWSIALRAHLGFSGADDPVWRVSHTEGRVGLLGAYVLELGRGDVLLGIELGAIGVRETRTRHQAQRLGSAGIDAERRGFTVGGFAAAELGVRLHVVESAAITVGAGPCWTLISRSTGRNLDLGFTGGLGLAWSLD